MADVLVVGGGIAGAAAGWFLARQRGGSRVTLLEAEGAPGMHATGRSAALFSEYFGNAAVRALTRHSRAFYAAPPAGFAAGALLAPRGVLALGTPETAAAFEVAKAAGAGAPRPAVELTAAAALALCPLLHPGAFDRALHKPGACDIDVDAAHQGFLRGLRAAGGTVVTGARVTGLGRRGGRWHAATSVGGFSAPLVVNAAGAWADDVARLAGVAPAGLVAYRRTAALAPVPDGHDVTGWPMVTDVADTFYARPEPGGLLLSPADATPMVPGPVRHDDTDVALAIARFEAMVALPLRHVSHAWAGLRTAALDDTPVIGPDPDAPGFCWLAGLGGYGIQTAPAAGELLAALAAGDAPPTALRSLVADVTPVRTRTRTRTAPL
ncbi:FAD-binding oxidoreductase [Streptomyces sp. NBC_01808]|uniref:NAD(P)/FAD-dependent oxidoreductase n=1 Tax=Streptomyces sp. NBC_01808 TaxID=2975947 RepID=UPI002DD9F43D|nr:FAD-dependent oxidoreductase [Streptomyces sp. NBC_01808]WSA38378.1 FAD-binding oxidoreductase [Streptomyces sp. NBC_01808]